MSEFNIFAVPAEGWMEAAYCKNHPKADLWHAETPEETKTAKRLCIEHCPVVEQCLAYALEHDEREGTWGGRSAGERARLRKGQPPPACERNHPGEPADHAPRPSGEWRCRACERVYTRNRRAA